MFPCLVIQLCPTLCDPVICSLPGSSVHGIFQARILEWVAISSSKVSSWRLILSGCNLSTLLSNYKWKGEFHCVDNFIAFQMIISWIFMQAYIDGNEQILKRVEPQATPQNWGWKLSSCLSLLSYYFCNASKLSFKCKIRSWALNLSNWSCIRVSFSFGCSLDQQPPASNFLSVCSSRWFSSYYSSVQYW